MRSPGHDTEAAELRLSLTERGMFFTSALGRKSDCPDAVLHYLCAAMPVSSTSFVRSTAALLVIGALSVIAIVAASLWLVARTDGYTEELANALAVRRAAFSVMLLIRDAETGQRGYLLTREEPYLEPYLDARSEIERQMQELRSLVGQRSSISEAVENLVAMIEEKLIELEETIALARDGRHAEAIGVVRSDTGEITMEAIRSASARLIDVIDTSIAANRVNLRQSVRGLSWSVAVGGVVMLLVVTASGWVAWRFTRDLLRSQEEVRGLNATLEERVRDRTREVARANDEIQRFAYIVSHDLRSPLVNIMGFTSELEAGLSSIRAHFAQAASDDADPAARDAKTAAEADMPEAIGFIRSSTAKMDNLINGILRLSREGRRVLSPQRVDMQEVLETAADSVRHQLSEGGGEIEVVRPIPAINSDRLALEQIFGNLVDNAVKYLDDRRPGRILLRGREMPTGVEYSVEDNGRGVAADDQERIFELFRRAGAQNRAGEGIGLTHVRALVRRLGGEISLESELGRGTTFRVSLPRNLPLFRESA
jgi:signal transduction histidine kinase